MFDGFVITMTIEVIVDETSGQALVAVKEFFNSCLTCFLLLLGCGSLIVLLFTF
jgi:hypothetical protein